EAAENFVNALADKAIDKVEAHVDGAINQVLAPINQLNAQVQGVQDAMNAVKNGDLSGVAGMVAGASGLPGAGELASAVGGGGGEGGGALDAGMVTNPLSAMAKGAAHNAIHQGVAAAHHALASALGIDAAGGGGESGVNAGGPAGDVAGVDAT